MGVRTPSVFSNAIVGSPAGSSETVVLTAPGIELIQDNAQVLIWWFVELTIGTSGVSVLDKLVRGNATGASAINAALAKTVSAGSKYRFTGFYADTPGVVANQVYSVTLTIASGAATSTVADGAIAVLVL